MSITLEEAKVGMADKVAQQVIDTFQRKSFLLNNLTFDNAISPGTGGSTLTYGYIQLQTPSTAATRSINSEYTPNEAKRVEKTTKAIIMGGSFQVDRVLQQTSGAVDELAFQAEQKIAATANLFHYLAINGTSATSGTGYATGTFDGLRKLLSGTSSEFESSIDVSTAELMDSNYGSFLDELDALVAAVDGGADALFMNSHMLLKVRGIARRAGYHKSMRDDFGRIVDRYNDIPLIDLGKYYNGTSSVDVIANTAASATAAGTGSIIAVKFGLDGFHGISPTGTSVIGSHMPDLNEPGAVKTGDVELVAGVALKNTRKAAILTNIGILPKTGTTGSGT